MSLEIGQKVPSFSVKDQNGNVVTSESIIGKKAVLYFYPKDDTPGCTKQACNLRDNYEHLLNSGYQVFGISTDDEKSHNKFITKYALPFPLLADTEQQMVQAFDVWKEKNMYGRTYFGIVRTTFVLDEQGIIVDIIKKVDTENHTSQIIK